MLAHPLFDQLKTLRCQGMLEAFQEQLNTPDINRLSFDERFALLVEREYLTRENRKLINRLRQAKLKEEACIEDINYSPENGLWPFLMATRLHYPLLKCTISVYFTPTWDCILS